MTKLLFGLLLLFSFVSAFSHFSDYTYFLVKVFPQAKGRQRTEGNDYRVLLRFITIS